MTELTANSGPPHVTQDDVASLAEKLKAVKLLPAAQAVLQHTMTGSALMVAYTRSFDIPDGYKLLDFTPLAQSVGRPQSPVRIREDGMPEVGKIAINEGPTIAEADVISLAIQLNRLELSRAESEILRHIVTGIHTLASQLQAHTIEGFQVLDYSPMLKFFIAPRIPLVLDKAGLPLVGVFPLREGVARKNQ